MRIAVASRWPYRECLRAASWRRSTSFGVRYSRSRRSALRGRRGVTVRFTMVEGSGLVLEFFTGNAVYLLMTFRIMSFLRTVWVGRFPDLGPVIADQGRRAGEFTGPPFRP